MRIPAAAGRWMYAVAIAGFGVHFLLHSATERIGAVGGPWIALRPFEAVIGGLLLVTGAAGIAARRQTRWAALLVALVILRVLLVHVSRVIANPANPGPWTGTAHLTGLLCVALVLMDDGRAGRLTSVGRSLLGASLVVYAVQHIRYLPFVAAFMPAWIPLRPFWAVTAAVSFFAAALCLVTAAVSPIARRLAPLTATLLGAMFLLFFLFVNLMRAIAAPHTAQEWTGSMVALAWAGGSWILAGALDRRGSAIHR